MITEPIKNPTFTDDWKRSSFQESSHTRLNCKDIHRRREHSTQTMAFEGGIMEGSNLEWKRVEWKKKTTRKQALKNKIYNILKPTSAIHLIQIFPDLTEKLCLGKWLHNDIRTEWERRRIFEWKNKKAQRNVAFSSPMSAWNLEDAWSIVSFSYAKDYS